MDITPLIPAGRQVVQSYKGGTFRISGAVYAEPVVVFPDTTHTWQVPPDFTALKIEDFEPLAAHAGELDVVLLGTGATTEFLPLDFRAALKQKGLSVEAMDTGAACRTYNVLMAEGRRVAAALFPVE